MAAERKRLEAEAEAERKRLEAEAEVERKRVEEEAEIEEQMRQWEEARGIGKRTLQGGSTWQGRGGKSWKVRK